MNDRMFTFFAHRYALGATLFAALVVTMVFKVIELGFAGYDLPLLGLARNILVLALVFSPWLILTALTRLKVQDGQVHWTSFPFPRRFPITAIAALEPLARTDGSIYAIRIRYGEKGSAKAVTLTRYAFPATDVAGLITALEAQRPDLTIPRLA